MAGTAVDAHRVEVDGQMAELDAERFSHITAATPPAEIIVVATDDLGNTAETALEAAAADGAPETARRVQMSMWAWASPVTREPVLDLAERGLISAVSLDIQDESGAIGHASDVDLARRSDAVMQTAAGAPRTTEFSGCTSFVDDEVRGDNLALAVEAAEAGVDETLWHAVHRLDSPLEDLVAEGL